MMDKILETAVSLVQTQAGGTGLFFIAACALGLVVWSQYLRIARHKEDLERERLIAQRAKDELARLEAGGRRKGEDDRVERRQETRISTSRVLVVEDNDEMQLIIPAMLNKCLTRPVVKVKASTMEAMEEMRSFEPELLILDLNLGGSSGLDVLKYLQAEKPELPVLVYSSYEDELVRALELRRRTGLKNLTVLQKGPDIDAFVQMVPHLFRRRATDRAAPGAAAPRQADGPRDRRRRATDRRATVSGSGRVAVL